MYTTQMLVDQLKNSLIRDKYIVPKDSIYSVRLATGEEKQEHVLYLSSAEDGTTLCQTASGTSFLYCDNLACTLNRLLEVCEYYSAWVKDLETASRTGCTLSELLDLAYPVISCPILILDNNQWMIACSTALTEMNLRENKDLSDLLQFHSSSAEKVAAFNLDFSECYQRKDVYPVPGNVFTTRNAHAMNLFHNERFSGLLIIESFDTPITQGKLDLFYLLGRQIQKMLNDPSSGLSIGTEEASFLRFLKEPSAENREELEHDLQVHSWEDNDEKQMLYIRPSFGRSLSPNLNHALIMFNRLFGISAAEYQDGILLFVNLRILKERSAYTSVTERIRQLSYCAGLSNSFSDISRLPIMAQRAYAALSAGDQSPGAINNFKDRYMQFFFSLVEEEDKKLLVHPLLNELKEYDRRYGSSLYETLFVFLKNERGITKTAKEMHLHRSTLLHRIERIESMADSQLEDPDARIQILLSYYLEQTGMEN